MRKLLVPSIALTMLTAAATAGAHATAATAADAELLVVHGFDDQWAPGVVAEPCPVDPVTPAPTPEYRLGGDRGTHATGLSFPGGGAMGGFQLSVLDAEHLESFSFALLHDAPPDFSDEEDGNVIVRFYPEGVFPNATEGFYAARTIITDPSAATWDTREYAGQRWAWYLRTSGGWQATEFTNTTIGEFAAAQPSMGFGISLSVELGCTGRPFYLDDLHVRVGGVVQPGEMTVDLEGIATRTYLSADPTPGSGPDDVALRDASRMTLTHGQGAYVLGDARVLGDRYTEADFISGTARMYRKAYGATTYSLTSTSHDLDEFTVNGYGQYLIRPLRRTSYQLRLTPTDRHETSSSKTLVVEVRRRIAARLADSTVRSGRRIIVTGVVAPKDGGIPVHLQRRTAAGWRTITSSRTTSTGSYRLSALATPVGRHTLRVLVPTARGNLQNTSRTFVVRITRRPPAVTTPTIVQPPSPVVPKLPTGDVKARVTITRTTAFDGGLAFTSLTGDLPPATP